MTKGMKGKRNSWRNASYIVGVCFNNRDRGKASSCVPYCSDNNPHVEPTLLPSVHLLFFCFCFHSFFRMPILRCYIFYSRQQLLISCRLSCCLFLSSTTFSFSPPLAFFPFITLYAFSIFPPLLTLSFVLNVAPLFFFPSFFELLIIIRRCRHSYLSSYILFSFLSSFLVIFYFFSESSNQQKIVYCAD